MAHELNIGTINGQSIEQILDSMVSKKIGIAYEYGNMYGYNVTFLNHDSSPIANANVYSADGELRGITNSSGKMNFLSADENNLLLYVVGTDGYLVYGRVEAYVGDALETTITSNNRVKSSAGLAIGDIITFAGNTWVIAHVEGDKLYMSDQVIESMTTFGDNNVYKGSTLANVAKQFENGLAAEDKAVLADVTIEDVTAKVFVASYSQMNGGWSYFNSNGRRICKHNDSASAYWTSSSSSDIAWNVNTSGTLSSNTPTSSNGFRPSVCLAL